MRSWHMSVLNAHKSGGPQSTVRSVHAAGTPRQPACHLSRLRPATPLTHSALCSRGSCSLLPGCCLPSIQYFWPPAPPTPPTSLHAVTVPYQPSSRALFSYVLCPILFIRILWTFHGNYGSHDSLM